MSRKTICAATLFLGAIFSGAFGQSAPHRLQDELIAADRGVWEAIASSPPKVDQASAALAPDYLDIDSGVRHSREEAIQFLHGVTKFSFQYENARAYILSPTSGYVVAELTYSSVQNGTAATGKVLTTTVLSKHKGRWLAHLHTEMDIKPEGH